jgi:hypothetical protein
MLLAFCKGNIKRLPLKNQTKARPSGRPFMSVWLEWGPALNRPILFFIHFISNDMAFSCGLPEIQSLLNCTGRKNQALSWVERHFPEVSGFIGELLSIGGSGNAELFGSSDSRVLNLAFSFPLREDEKTQRFLKTVRNSKNIQELIDEHGISCQFHGVLIYTEGQGFDWQYQSLVEEIIEKIIRF